MGKHQKLDDKRLEENPELAVIVKNIDETKAALEMLKVEKAALKSILKEAKKLLKKQLKAKPKKEEEEKDKAVKPKKAAKAEAESGADKT